MLWKQSRNKNSPAQSRSEVDKVSAKIVKEACSRMKPGKTDVSGVYTSDVFLHAPDSLYEHLAAIFQSYLTHGTVSLQILSCAFLPLFKGVSRTLQCLTLPER